MINIYIYIYYFRSHFGSGSTTRASMQPVIAPHRELLDVAGPHSSWEKHDDRIIAKHTEVLKDFLQARAATWVLQHIDEPILEVFQSDGTPVTTVEREADRWEDYQVVRRGKQTEEYLIQRLWLSDVHGDVTPLFQEPRLLADKTALTHYSGHAELWKGARAMGAEHAVLSHHCFDSAVKAPLEHRFRQERNAYEYMLSVESAATAAQMILWSWFTCVACKAHLFHNALKWAMLVGAAHTTLMRNTWVVLASLTNAFEQLVDELPQWIRSMLAFEDWDPETCRDTWTTLHITGTWLEFICDLQLRFKNGQLWIAEKFANDEHAHDKVKIAILFLWRFRRWCEARWCGVGRCSRQLLASLFVGLEHLVKGILARKHSHKYHLSGFERLDAGIKRMLAITACSSLVSEKPLALLLQDNRLALTLPDIDREMDEQATKVLTIPEHTIAELARTADMSCTELRDGNCQSVDVQMVYARHGLREVRQQPWTLCRGDVVQNLNDLHAGAKPTEEVSARIWDLLEMGETPETLKPVVDLLAQVPWTTKAVEDPHRVANAIMKCKKAKGRNTILPISVLRQAAPLFRRSMDEQKVQNLQKRIDAVRRRQTWKINGRHAYCKALIETARDAGTSGTVVAQNFGTRVLKFHGKRWDEMDMRRKNKYRDDAVGLRLAKQAVNKTQRESLICKLRSAKQKREENLKKNRSMDLLDRCRFSDATLCEYDSFFNKTAYTREYVEEQRRQANTPLQQPIGAVVATLDLFPGTLRKTEPPRPEWLRWMAHNREFFPNTMLRVTLGPAVLYYKFAFASQNPLNIGMHAATLAEDYEPLLHAGLQADQDLEAWEYSFDLDLSRTYYTDTDDFTVLGELSVLPDVHLRVTRYLGSDSNWMTIDEVKAFLPEHPRTTAEKEPDTEHIVEPEPWMEDPYMWEFVKAGGDTRCSTKVQPKFLPKDDDRSSCSDGSDCTLDDVEAMDALLERREELEEEREEGQETFWWTLRGGPWTKKNKGVAFDAYAAMARGKDAKAWCVHYRLKRSVSFSIQAHTEVVCIKLCTQWCQRMRYFWTVWTHKGCDFQL